MIDNFLLCEDQKDSPIHHESRGMKTHDVRGENGEKNQRNPYDFLIEAQIVNMSSNGGSLRDLQGELRSEPSTKVCCNIL